MSFEYFYVGDEYEFAFYRLPKELIRSPAYRNISMEAKVLYGCMLDRHELSVRNGWHDEKGRVFIYYTFEQICGDLFVSRKKAAAMLNELENQAGLIRRTRQGQGRPNRIYVRRFHVRRQSEPVSDGNSQKYPMETSGSIQSELQEVSGGNENNTDKNKTERNKTNPIDPMDAEKEIRAWFDYSCAFDALKIDYPNRARELDEIRELLVDVCTTTKPTIRISGEDKPAAVVISRLKKLNSFHIAYVLDCLEKTTTKITNIRQYLLAVLYNAPVTMDHYYSMLVQHDMAEGKV
ncbi:MAG: DUF6017 domain-containing protein [Bilifractor sp.]|jgi:hypothetical protein